jgi:hypothetical protein
MTILSEVGRNKFGQKMVRAQCCSCENTFIAREDNVKAGRTSRCENCRKKRTPKVASSPRVKHPAGTTKEQFAYNSAKSRCTNPNHPAWADYGGRGIKFLFTSFEQFYAELGPRPPRRSLDRIDNEGNYEPGNVRWATKKEQATNTRKCPMLSRELAPDITPPLLERGSVAWLDDQIKSKERAALAAEVRVKDLQAALAASESTDLDLLKKWTAESAAFEKLNHQISRLQIQKAKAETAVVKESKTIAELNRDRIRALKGAE